MTIKEFSHKHAQFFFWATIVLVIILFITTCGRRYDSRHEYMMGGGYERYNKNMMNRDGFNKQGGQRQMMGPCQGQNQPLINDTPEAAGTVESGTSVKPNIPIEVQ